MNDNPRARELADYLDVRRPAITELAADLDVLSEIGRAVRKLRAVCEVAP